MAFDEVGALHEHAAQAAGLVEDAAVEGLNDLDDELDDMEVEVKDSPPFCPSLMADLPRTYS